MEWRFYSMFFLILFWLEKLGVKDQPCTHSSWTEQKLYTTASGVLFHPQTKKGEFRYLDEKKKTNTSRYLQHYNKVKSQLITLLLKGVSPFLQFCSFVELTVKADKKSLMHEVQTGLPQGNEDHSLCSSLCNSTEGKSAPWKRGALYQSCWKESSARGRERCTSPLQSWEQGPSHLKLSLKRWLILLCFASSSKTLQDVFSAVCLQICCICLPSPGVVKRTWTPPDGAHLFSLCCKSCFSLAVHSTNTRIILLIFM